MLAARKRTCGSRSYGCLVKPYVSFSPIRDLAIRDAQGFLLVYSITSRISFDQAIELHSQIFRIKGTGPMPVIIVGNQCDLEYERQVGINGVSAVFLTVDSEHYLVLPLSRW